MFAVPNHFCFFITLNAAVNTELSAFPRLCAFASGSSAVPLVAKTRLWVRQFSRSAPCKHSRRSDFAALGIAGAGGVGGALFGHAMLELFTSGAGGFAAGVDGTRDLRLLQVDG